MASPKNRTDYNPKARREIVKSKDEKRETRNGRGRCGKLWMESKLGPGWGKSIADTLVVSRESNSRESNKHWSLRGKEGSRWCRSR